MTPFSVVQAERKRMLEQAAYRLQELHLEIDTLSKYISGIPGAQPRQAIEVLGSAWRSVGWALDDVASVRERTV